MAPLSLSPSRTAPASCRACQMTAAAIAPARICRMRDGGRDQDLERHHEQRHVQRDGQRGGGRPHADADGGGAVGVGGGAQRGQHGGDDHAAAAGRQQQQAAQPGPERIVAGVTRHAPYPVQRVLGGLDDAEAAVEAAENADDQAGHAPVERVDVPGDLVTDHRELGQRGVQHLPLEVRAVVQPVTEKGGQEQQQRKQRHDAVVGDLRGQVAALIVEELVDHRHAAARPSGDAAGRRQPGRSSPWGYMA